MRTHTGLVLLVVYTIWCVVGAGVAQTVQQLRLGRMAWACDLYGFAGFVSIMLWVLVVRGLLIFAIPAGIATAVTIGTTAIWYSREWRDERPQTSKRKTHN